MPFTDKQIAALKPKAARYEKKEPGRTGLSLRVTPRGQKTWTFVYRHDGAQRRMVLGNYPPMGVAAAHKALAAAREQLEAGNDPGEIIAQERKAEREADTVDDLVEEYLERHARPNTKPSTAAEDERLLRREVLPYWTGRKAKDITRRDVIRVLDTVADRGAPVLRNRVGALLSRLFMFALDRGVVEASPAVGVRRLEETSRDRFLSIDEIRSFWNGIDKTDMTPPMRAALRFALVTGQRRSEVAGAARAEIDDKEHVWRLPASRSKNGRPSLIPLPALALRLIAEAADVARLRPVANSDPTPSLWLFSSGRLGRPLDSGSLTCALNRNRDVLGIGDATLHDLRRTFATYHGEIGTPPDILSALLHHAPTSITAQVYNRATNLEPRRKAMVAWCAWLERVIAGEKVSENVVPLRAAQQ